MSEPIRILHVIGAMYPGGMENFIMNLYEHIDRTKIQFDFAVHARKENDYIPLIEEMGGKVYDLPRLTGHPVQSLQTLKAIVRDNQYPIVIRHTANALVAPQLLVSKHAGARTICHAHSETDPQKAIHYLGRLLMGVSTTRRFACSDGAGKWMYGNRSYEILKNAIDLNKFAYAKEKRNKIRKEFSIEEKHVYGHVGNLAPVKNHSFLLDVFAKICEKDEKAVLICVGDGQERAAIEEKIQKLSLEDRVILSGVRRDADAFLSAFDVLIFPSIYEGLPLSLIEAQTAGLPALISDAVTRQAKVTDGLMHFLPLSVSAEEWADKAVSLMEQRADRTCQRDKIAAAGYDIDVLTAWYQDYMLALAGQDYS